MNFLKIIKKIPRLNYIFLIFIFTLVSCKNSNQENNYENNNNNNEYIEIGEEVTILNNQSYEWKPLIVGTTWQWQLDQPIDLSIIAEMYDIDLFENDAAIVDKLHSQNKIVICYISVGSYENWRPDANQFPDEVIGKAYSGWPGENWLDIRQIDLLAPIMRARFDECKDKGFDGIEPDNMDAFSNNTGFPLTYQDQLVYNIWLSKEAHKRGLSIGMKNNSEQIIELLPYFDWALTEDCFAEEWCEEMLPFIQAGKPVFAAEYTDMDITLEDFCQQAKSWNFSALLKNRELDSYMENCD